MLGSRQYWSLHQETAIVITNPQQLNGKSQQCALCHCILCLRMTVISDLLPLHPRIAGMFHQSCFIWFWEVAPGLYVCLMHARSTGLHSQPSIASTFLPFPCAYSNFFLDVLCSYPALVPFPQAACLRD